MGVVSGNLRMPNGIKVIYLYFILVYSQFMCVFCDISPVELVRLCIHTYMRAGRLTD